MAETVILKVDDKAAIAAMERLIKRGTNTTPVMRIIAGIMADAVEENFEKEGRPKWQELSDSTIKRREEAGHWPGKILQETGHLASSIEHGSNARSAWAGTNVVYAAVHHFGRGSISSIATHVNLPAIPARPFMQLTEGDMEEIKAAITNFVTIRH